MNRPGKRHIVPLVLAASFLLGACEHKLDVQGNVFKPDDVDLILPGESNRQQVRSILGSPTFVHRLREEKWVYINDSRFKGSRAVNQVVILFDEKGIVEDVERNFDDELLTPAGERARHTAQEGWISTLLWPTRDEFGPVDTVGLPPEAMAADQLNQRGKRKEKETSYKDKWWYKLIVRPHAAGWWDRHKPIEVAPPEKTQFTPEEGGWWKGIWSSDPTTAPAPAPEEKTPEDKEKIWEGLWPDSGDVNEPEPTEQKDPNWWRGVFPKDPDAEQAPAEEPPHE